MVERIHRSPWKTALVSAGAGSEAVESLLNHPGASNTVMDVAIPYSPLALSRYAPGLRGGAVSDETARALATRARTIAEALSGAEHRVAGVACTAALATIRERRGEDHGYICIAVRGWHDVTHVRFRKGELDRAQQERWISHLLLNAVAGLAGVPPIPPFPDPMPEIKTTRFADASPMSAFWGGALDAVVIEPDGRVLPAPERMGALLPGSFHPLHRGHTLLARAAERILGQPVALELSVQNVDKDELRPSDLDARLRHIGRRHRLVVTRAPLFVDKARRFNRCRFVLGYDTAVRLLDASYYGGAERRDAALDEIQRLGCRFLVAGRERDGTFYAWDDRQVPGRFSGMFEAIPETVFREDIHAEWIRSARSAYEEQA